MNTLHLTYAVEVARCGSITQAAENLYMAQPNLSKAIKELEESMGFAIFARTSRGVVPTARGEEFLGYARAVLGQVRNMEALRNGGDAQTRFSLALPRDGRFAQRAARLAAEVSARGRVNGRILTAGAQRVLSEVAEGQYTLGILRFPVSQEPALRARIRERGLVCRELGEETPLVTFAGRHPLASRPLSLEALAQYPEITGEEDQRPGTGGRIALREDGLALELLAACPTAFQWRAPEEAALLERYGLVQRPCPGAEKQLCLLIHGPDARLSEAEERFLELL